MSFLIASVTVEPIETNDPAIQAGQIFLIVAIVLGLAFVLYKFVKLKR